MLSSVAKGFWNPAKVLPVYYIYTATGRITIKVSPKQRLSKRRMILIQTFY